MVVVDGIGSGEAKMPGICGIIRARLGSDDQKLTEEMTKAMMHEKFYVMGGASNSSLGITIGWVTRRGSFSDCLPIWNENKDICLFFSGEDFRDKREVYDLREKGHAFGSANASYLVHMYEDAGVSFLENLNGWFCAALLDSRENKVIIFNDKYGLGRIYLYQDKNALFFSSEAKSLLKVLPHSRELDSTAVGELVFCGQPLENRTIFKNIKLLPPASVLTISPMSDPKIKRYFSIDKWENQNALDEKSYYIKLKETFARVISRYISGEERVGVSLTGGIDTRMIMAWAPFDPFKVPCYTFSGMYRECTDAVIARRVAAAAQQWHQTISVNRKFFSDFPALAKRAVFYSDGAMDVSGAIELYMNYAARSIAPVRLTGNYGDQVLRGLSGMRSRILWEGMLDSNLILQKEAAVRVLEEQRVGPPLSVFLFKQLPWEYYGRLAVEQTQVTLRTPFLDNDIVALAFTAPSDKNVNFKLSLKLILDGNAVLGKIPTDRGVVSSPLCFLNKVNRMYSEFMIKAEYAFDYGMPEWLRKIDKMLAPMRLEKLFLGRHKFYHFRIWYRNELSSYIKAILLDPRTLSRPFFNRKGIEKLVDSHTSGERNFTSEIHMALSLELIQRNLIEKI